MRTIEKVIYHTSRKDTFRLWHLTDLHLGARACDEKLLKQHVAEIAADPNAYWIGGGDYVDAICQAGDRRFNVATLSKWVIDAWHNDQDVDTMGIEVNYFLDLFAPIWHKCLALGSGNHEYMAERFYARNIYMDIVRRAAPLVGVTPQELALGVSGFLNIKFRRGTPDNYGSTWVLSVFQHHGYGGGILAGGHALALERALGNIDADLLLFGHRHVSAYVDKVITRPDPQSGTWKQRHRVGMFSPSYLNTWIEPSKGNGQTDSYSEREGYAPKVLGARPIVISPDKQKFAVLMGASGFSYADLISEGA